MTTFLVLLIVLLGGGIRVTYSRSTRDRRLSAELDAARAAAQASAEIAEAALVHNEIAIDLLYDHGGDVYELREERAWIARQRAELAQHLRAVGGEERRDGKAA